MAIDLVQARQLLNDFAFDPLFIEELGWDRHRSRLDVELDGHSYVLQAIAEKRGMVTFALAVDGDMPDYATRRKIDRKVAKSSHEHLIIYHDADHGTQIWQWVKREAGRPAACREHTYHTSQSGDALIQKLQSIAFSLEEEEGLTLVDVTSRVRASFDVERVTKRFYDIFKKEHAAFLKMLKGIPDEDIQRWYVSVMLNRLMFIYFIQRKRFLDDDPDYLRNKLAASKAEGKDRFYLHVLCPLFFEGFAKKPEDRSAAVNKLLGQVPYLNGGLFLKHQIEKAHGKDIQIPDRAFEKIFDFFNQYDWHLDERPLRDDKEINPDVLGYIFEKYINQKQMGAYYTKEDITGYISRNTVIPFLLDAARKKCKIAFEGERSVWRLLAEDPDRYIYPAMRHGTTFDIRTGEILDAPRELPPEIAAGLDNVANRTEWNTPAPAEFALPTEIWREVVARRQRYQEVRDKLAAGEVRDVNDLITLNLDIEQFAQDVIETCEGPELLRAIWVAIAGKIPEKSNEKHHQGITVLDPACGSGAFLFAALNLLEVLYEACLDRMQAFLDDLDITGDAVSQKYSDFRKILKQIDEHPSRKYFIYKSIVINNLYGVDIMEEAVEICKLRLFLKLVAQVDSVEQIEPLPDIDFNIRAGNSLVGHATREHVRKAIMSDDVGAKLMFDGEVDALARFEQGALEVEELYEQFRQQQTTLGGTVTAEDKQALQDKLDALDSELNQHLAREYGVDPGNAKKYDKWLSSHEPLHWFVDFYGIMAAGGFDVVIGNPPYVEKRVVGNLYRVAGYSTDTTNNLYAYFVERALSLLATRRRFGYIVPLSSMSTGKFVPLQTLVHGQQRVWLSSFDDRPSRLFDGLEHIQLTIVLFQTTGTDGADHRLCTTRCHKWSAIERVHLFSLLQYATEHRLYLAGSTPKVGKPIEVAILDKLWRTGSALEEVVLREGAHQVFYTRKVHAFLNVLDFVPDIRDEDGQRRDPSEQKILAFTSKVHADATLCILNSSLFRWFLTTFSDCRNLNKREVMGFPVQMKPLVEQYGPRMSELGASLSDNLQGTSEYREMTFGGNRMRVQCIIPKHSKPIIDEVDRVLGRYYGFSDEEIDHILNYDIKYRTGVDGSDD